MPLETMITRNGKPVVKEWYGYHVPAMVFAASWDSGEGIFEDNTEPPMQEPDRVDGNGKGPLGHYIHPSYTMLIGYQHIGMTPLNTRAYTLKKDYTFIDATNANNVLELKAGDVLSMRRVSK